MMIPGAAGASTTRLIVCHCVAPSAREPSRSPSSTLAERLFGRPDDRREDHQPERDHPREERIPKLRKRTRKVKPKRPKTIEGVPFSRSTAFRMMEVSRFSRWYWAR